MAQRRVRVPAPLIGWRLGSGRGATEQPNATGDGAVQLSARFWVLLALTGVAAGLFGDALMLLLHTVEHLVFDYRAGTFQAAVERVPGWWRVAALALAGLVGGFAWHLLRRATPGERSEVDDAVWSGDGELSPRRSLGTSVLSVLVIGMGASLGREAAPKLMGGVSGTVLARWGRLAPAQRRMLVACGAGAGFAAVYNVPLGGALFTAEVLCGAVTLPTVLPALVCSCVATVTAWLYLPDQPTYPGVPGYPFSTTALVWAVLAGPVIGLIAVGYIRGIGWVSLHRVSGWWTVPAMVGGFAVLGVVGIGYPQLFGNGKDMAHDVFLGNDTGLLLVAALFVLKPLMTALCLGVGASGGLFTPTMSTGAMLGALLGGLWSLAWPGSSVGAYAVIGATAMIGAAMQAPLAALALMIELTHTGLALMVPLVVATALATATARYVDGYSIYSARLPAE